MVEGLEFACGMPALHHRAEMLAECAAQQMPLSGSVDLCAETGLPFHFCFSHSPLFMWLVRSRAVGALIKAGQLLRVLPKGFHDFNKVFLSGTVAKIVQGGQMGILDGGEILVFTKQADA